MTAITTTTPGTAWKKAIKIVLDKGEIIQDDGENLYELINVSILIKKPTKIDQIVKDYGDIEMLKWMRNNFHSTEPVENWGYCYGQRLQNFEGINQMEKVIIKLKKNPQTKSATLNFTFPPGDVKHMPCVNILDLKFRNNKLNASVFMRSQDAGKKLYADIISMGEIVKEIAQKVGQTPGELLIHISSLHVYEKDLNKFKELINS